jgi:hypothetical protein
LRYIIITIFLLELEWKLKSGSKTGLGDNGIDFLSFI